MKNRAKTQHYLTKRQRSEIKGTMQPRVPHWWEKEVKGKKPTRICKRCHGVYFDEHWHSSPELYEQFKGRSGVKETHCAECSWVRAGFQGVVNYEGEVRLLEVRDPELKAEVIKQARNIGARAARRDPEDQIIKIEDKGNEVRITTTENQLAVSIGKQIARAHKGGKLEISWSHEDMPARAVWTAHKK